MLPGRFPLSFDWVKHNELDVMDTVTALWGMARPLIMVSVVLVYFMGNLIARAFGYAWDLPAFLWGLAALIFGVGSIHYANEYADFQTDALTTRTPFSGGSGVLPSGRVSRSLALHAAWGTLILSEILATIGWLSHIVSGNVLLLLLLGIAAGWMYSLPPLALAWHGWGEVDNAVLGGIVLPLYGYTVQAGRIDWWVIIGCLPFALLVFINLLATTWADREADVQVGKRTLATRLSTRQLRLVYGLAALCCFAALPLLALDILPPVVALGGFMALPLVLWADCDIRASTRPIRQ